MKTELPLDREALRKEIKRDYGLEPGPLEFLPKGEVACAYVLDGGGGRRLLLKVFAASRMARITTERMPIWLTLCWELYQKGWLREIAVPLKTLAGELFTRHRGHPAALFEFIEGEVLDRAELWKKETVKDVGSLLARIHAQSEKVRKILRSPEDFGVPFGDDLMSYIGETERIHDGGLKDAVLPRKDMILKRLSQLRNRAQALPQESIPQGLVHTDLHGANMVRDKDGRIHALDWEGARLAPFEQDFFSWHESPEFPEFMEGYTRILPAPLLSKATLEFYGLRRRLEDVTDWISRLLRPDISMEQRENDLRGLAEDLAVLAQI